MVTLIPYYFISIHFHQLCPLPLNCVLTSSLKSHHWFQICLIWMTVPAILMLQYTTIYKVHFYFICKPKKIYFNYGGDSVDFIIPTYKQRNWMLKNSDFPQLLVNADLELKARSPTTKSPLTSFHSLFNSPNFWLVMYNVYRKIIIMHLYGVIERHRRSLKIQLQSPTHT